MFPSTAAGLSSARGAAEQTASRLRSSFWIFPRPRRSATTWPMNAGRFCWRTRPGYRQDRHHRSRTDRACVARDQAHKLAGRQSLVAFPRPPPPALQRFGRRATTPLLGKRGEGEVADRDPGLLPGGKRGRGPGHDRAGRRGRSGTPPGRTAWGLSRPVMILVVRVTGLGVELDLDGPHLAGVGAAGDAGPVDLGVRHVPSGSRGGPFGAQLVVRNATRPARTPQAGLTSSHSRAASTARMCARRASAGRVAGVAEPGGGHPVAGRPAPARARVRACRWRHIRVRRHRRVILVSRSGWTRSASASRS